MPCLCRKPCQAYINEGKPVEALSEAERFVISLMQTPRAAARLRAFSLKFAAEEKHAEAASVFKVGLCFLFVFPSPRQTSVCMHLVHTTVLRCV